MEFFETDSFFVFNVENTREVAGPFIGSDRSLSEKFGRVVQGTSGAGRKG